MKKLNEIIQAQFLLMCKTGKLFKSKLTGRQVWNIYLESFTDENDPHFRDPKSSIHNCNHCNNFIKRYGNVVALDENNSIITMFDVIDKMDDDTFIKYNDSLAAMNEALKSNDIQDVFFETYNELNSLPYESCSKSNEIFRLGVDKNHKRYTKEEANLFGVVKPNETRTFNHFFLDLPKQFVNTTGSSIESIMANYRSNKEVFKRGLDEISLDTLFLVRDLINQGSLLNGDTHLHKVEKFIVFKEEYDNLAVNQKDNWCWIKSFELAIAKFKNELIGVLCSDLSEVKELNKACKDWNYRVDPANYMKAVAPITENQKKQAQKFVEENGYIESFNRRHAILDDIKADEIKHINTGTEIIKSASIFDGIKTKSSRHKKNEFEGVEEISIDKFMKDILPGCTSVEAYLENRLENNLVNITTSNQEDCKQMFKWSNPYSFTYKGNLAGKSEIKENVSKAGGNIDALVRCSLQWNDEDTKGIVDFDLHSVGKNHIYYSNNGRTHSCGGHLDVDMINPPKVGIENITWKKKIEDGSYKLRVKNFNGSNNTGFKVEIEFNGEIFNYHKTGNVKGYTDIATLTVVNGIISIEHHLSETTSSKTIYNLETQQFHKVNLMCLSPNHWGENKVGNKHFFFMLDKAKCDTSIRSFHSENLDPELAKHRKVLEVLGAVNMLEPVDKQLAGIGFNATVKDELILRLKGNFQRVVKVKF